MPRRQRVVAKAPITPNAIDSCTAYPCDYTISICNVALRDEMQKSHFQEAIRKMTCFFSWYCWVM